MAKEERSSYFWQRKSGMATWRRWHLRAHYLEITFLQLSFQNSSGAISLQLIDRCSPSHEMQGNLLYSESAVLDANVI